MNNFWTPKVLHDECGCLKFVLCTWNLLRVDLKCSPAHTHAYKDNYVLISLIVVIISLCPYISKHHFVHFIQFIVVDQTSVKQKGREKVACGICLLQIPENLTEEIRKLDYGGRGWKECSGCVLRGQCQLNISNTAFLLLLLLLSQLLFTADSRGLLSFMLRTHIYAALSKLPNRLGSRCL